MLNKKIVRLIAVTALILLIPFVATQFSADVNWSFMDFAIAAVLLIGTVLVYEFVVARLRTKKSRLIAGTALLAVFMLIWIHLAVGIVDSWPLAGS